MSDDPKLDARTLWRDQPTEETPPMTLAQIHARGYQTWVRRRNMIEYVGGGVVLAFCAWFGFRLQDDFQRVGLLLMAVGTVFALWNLHRRGGAQSVPALAGAKSLDFHRQQLVRQRDMFRGAWRWYIVPVIPALAVIFGGAWLKHPERIVPLSIMAAVSVAISIAIFLNHQRGARKLQAQIDEIDALMGFD